MYSRQKQQVSNNSIYYRGDGTPPNIIFKKGFERSLSQKVDTALFGHNAFCPIWYNAINTLYNYQGFFGTAHKATQPFQSGVGYIAFADNLFTAANFPLGKFSGCSSYVYIYLPSDPKKVIPFSQNEAKRLHPGKSDPELYIGPTFAYTNEHIAPAPIAAKEIIGCFVMELTENGNFPRAYIINENAECSIDFKKLDDYMLQYTQTFKCSDFHPESLCSDFPSTEVSDIAKRSTKLRRFRELIAQENQKLIQCFIKSSPNKSLPLEMPSMQHTMIRQPPSQHLHSPVLLFRPFLNGLSCFVSGCIGLPIISSCCSCGITISGGVGSLCLASGAVVCLSCLSAYNTHGKGSQN